MVPFIHIIDDFLDDPLALRSMALRMRYAIEGTYPGLNSVETIRLPGIEQFVSRLTGEPLRAMPPPGSHGHCRLSLASDPAEPNVHVDPSHWTGVLYLSLERDCQSGTDFFVHKRTGIDRVPRSLEELERIGYRSYTDFQREVVDRDGPDRSAWELSSRVAMRFNRLVLLQPQYWHTSGSGFGSSVENGRLVYLMFFRRADQD